MKLSKIAMKLKPSATLALTSKAKAMKKEGIDVISFAAGEPDFDTPSEIKDAAIDAINKGFTKYTPASGIEELKKAVSRKFKTENALDYAPDEIVISCGAKHSLYNIFQVICNMQDEVVIIAPYWVSYPEMVMLAGAKAVFIKTRPEKDFKLSVKDLKNKISKKTKAIIVNSPSNPAGVVYSSQDLKEIADIAVSKKVFVVSDEIYEKIIFDDEKHASIASFGKKIYDLALTVNGVSKTYSMTGWRIGYAGGPPEIMRLIGALQDHSTSNPASISQWAALEALNMDSAGIEKMRSDFEERRNHILSRLEGIAKISYVKPGGAFYVFCDISGTGMDADTFAGKLLEEERVCVIPGADFGFNDHIRLSFATDRNSIDKGMDRLEKFVGKNG